MDGLKVAAGVFAGGLVALAFILMTAFAMPVRAAGACGVASWYGPGFHGRPTASGARFDQDAMTAAHKSLPFGSRVRVVDQRTGMAVRVTITDRGLDLSREAATRLGMRERGHSPVCLEVL